MVKHSQAHAESCYNEGELADLGKREARLDSHTQALPGDKHAAGAEHYHANDYHNRQEQDGPPVLYDHRRLHHHAYRDEKHRAKQVFYRSHHMLNALGIACAGED